MAVPSSNTTIVTSSENYKIAYYTKLRLLGKASGAGNVDLVLRLSVNGGYDYFAANTFPMGDGVNTVFTQLN